MSSYSQNVVKPGEPYDAYCELSTPSTLFYSDIKTGELRNADGSKLKLVTTLEHLNYMSKRGWELVKYGEPLILKKRVTSDEEILECLYFKQDFKKEKNVGKEEQD